MTPTQRTAALRWANALQAGADDPMWANHAEMRKSTLEDAAALLRELVSGAPVPVGLPAGEQTGPVSGAPTSAQEPWESLRDPAILHANLLRGQPAQLSREQFLHLAGEPVQEPVAWQWLDTATFREKIPATAVAVHWRPLYAYPPQRQPLSDEQIDELVLQEQFLLICDGLEELTEIVRAVEQAHGITGETK